MHDFSDKGLEKADTCRRAFQEAFLCQMVHMLANTAIGEAFAEEQGIFFVTIVTSCLQAAAGCGQDSPPAGTGGRTFVYLSPEVELFRQGAGCGTLLFQLLSRRTFGTIVPGSCSGSGYSVQPSTFGLVASLVTGATGKLHAQSRLSHPARDQSEHVRPP